MTNFSTSITELIKVSGIQNLEMTLQCQYIADIRRIISNIFYLHMKNVNFSFFLLFYRDQYLFKNRPTDGPPNSFYRSLYPKIIQDIEVRFFKKHYFV